MHKKLDSAEFRKALAIFPTGVTVITTADAHGNWAGITASSLNSVSLDPPLILWSIARCTPEFDIFTKSKGFCVHVLHETQEAISNQFANPYKDKFNNLPTTPATCFPDIPCLTEYAARFECRTWNQYDGGDHVILVGEVLHVESVSERPLLFVNSAYNKLPAP